MPQETSSAPSQLAFWLWSSSLYCGFSGQVCFLLPSEQPLGIGCLHFRWLRVRGCRQRGFPAHLRLTVWFLLSWWTEHSVYLFWLLSLARIFPFTYCLLLKALEQKKAPQNRTNLLSHGTRKLQKIISVQCKLCRVGFSFWSLSHCASKCIC